jgi:hypothetical protein
MGFGKCPRRMHSILVRWSDQNLNPGTREWARRLTISWGKSVACYICIILFTRKWKVPFTGIRIYCAPTDSHGWTWKYGYCITISTAEIMQCQLENAGMFDSGIIKLLHDAIPNNCTSSLDNDLDGLRKTKIHSTTRDLRFAVHEFSKECGTYKH